MGCSSSKLDDSDVVLRCLRRKRLMREAVSYREDFAFAQLTYIETLRKVGHALRHFSEGDTSDTQTPPKSSIMSSPSAVAARSPPLATFVHPPESPSVASESLSPALKTANRPPVISPLSTTTPQESSPTFFGSEAGAPLPTINGSPPYGGREEMASPLKNADYSSPFHSPARESDGFFMPFTSSDSSVPQYAPPSPSSHQSSSWDPFSLFHSSPFTYHNVQEQRRLSEVQEMEEEVPDFAKVAQEEGLPDLEEEEQEYEKEQPEQNEEQNHKEESKTAHSEDRGPEPIGLSTEKAVEKVDENQGGDVGVIVPVKKQDDASFTIVKGKNLTEAVNLIDDQFAKVVDKVKELSGMLETHGLHAIHRHASILDFRDSSKVLNAIIWHRPRKTAARLNDVNEASLVADSGMEGSHASTLERIYVWEKKLYEEVKAGEYLRIAFDKKCKQLNILESKGEDHLVEKTKIAIRGLDSQLVVALKAVHSASMSIQQLTNEELFPQLAEMLGGLMTMWKVMLECHKTQKAIALGLQTLENPKGGVEASEAHRNATIELEHEIEKWRDHIQLWVSSQEKYIKALLAWLRLCHTEPEKDGSSGAMAPNRTMREAPIYLLIKSWHGSLAHFVEHMKVVNALKNFARVLHALQIGQSELLFQKKQVEAFAKDSDRRTGSLQTIRKRYREAVYSGSKANRIENQSGLKDTHQEKESFLNSSKNNLEEEHKQTLSCLQEYLPDIFEATTSLAEIALREYEILCQDTESLKSKRKEQASEE